METQLAVTDYRHLLSDQPADLQDPAARAIAATVQHFPEEAIYVYSLAENRMVYASGWLDILGYADDEIGLVTIVNSTAAEYARFSHELNEKALSFMLRQHEHLLDYSFSIELKKLHKNGTEVPMIVRVGVFAAAGGRATQVIGRLQINRSIALGKVMRYAAYGPEKAAFEEELSKELFQHFAISDKEKEALGLVAQGFTFKEIAGRFGISLSAVEKRILPMYKRFGVRSLPHLITFAYENAILP